MENKLLTIFTPTYNRLETLTVLYDSLCRQTSRNFCWLIIDDGSTDETSKEVYRWIGTGKVDIQYYYQKNSGKMVAHNVGVHKCVTELFLCVDSDDYLVEDAVESITDFWHEGEDFDKCSGIIAYKGKSETEVLVNYFMDGIMESSLSDMYDRGFRGDTTLIFKTEIIKKYPFPEIKDEKFITEAFVYDQIDQKYMYRIYRKILTICKYREDGYTRNGMKIIFRNPGGWAIYCQQKGNLADRKKDKYKMYAWSISYRFMAGKKELPHVGVRSKVLYIAALPIGFSLYIRRMLKYKWGKDMLK